MQWLQTGYSANQNVVQYSTLPISMTKLYNVTTGAIRNSSGVNSSASVVERYLIAHTAYFWNESSGVQIATSLALTQKLFVIGI